MTLESRRDLPENGTLQKKIPPYEAEFIFSGLRMTLDYRLDLAENGTLQKNTPLQSRIYSLVIYPLEWRHFFEWRLSVENGAILLSKCH